MTFIVLSFIDKALAALSQLKRLPMPQDIVVKLNKARSLIVEIKEFYITNEEHPTVVDNSIPPPPSDNS